MKTIQLRLAMLLSVALLISLAGGEIAIAQEAGFKPIFDGKTLKGWDGDPKFWSVQDEAITGQTTKENPTKGNTFIIWRAGQTANFELKLEYKIIGGNSGIQYRSFPREGGADKWRIGGYQADFEAGKTYSGILYGEAFRGILANRGQKTVIGTNGKPKVVGSVGESSEIQKKIKNEDWNSYHIIANGNHFVHKINGVVTCEATDEDDAARADGLLALQLHAGPPMKVQFRNIHLKELPPSKAKPIKKKASRKKTAAKVAAKKVAFVAGNRSHGYGSHEHYAGCMILARSLQASGVGLEVKVFRNGWPKEKGALEGFDSVVMYADGGGRHPVNAHLTEMDALAKKGVGIVCIHYGVEVPKGDSGDRLLDWIGGYFETHWSVNPHWTAKFAKLPKHPVTRGVKPFEINDEWYYHMRFRKDLKGVTPILSALPPKSTLVRKDGPHSGNPHVRAAVARGESQHVAWAAERPDGGRGFGFTGGHFHWNWGDPNFRKLVLNAIAWTAKVDVPAGGIGDKPLTLEDLQKNQDYPAPGNFNGDSIRDRLKLPGGKKSANRPAPSKGKAAKAVYTSPLVTSQTKGHAVAIDVNIKGARELFLVVNDGGNGYSCDWADWAEPRLVGPQGTKKLTDLKWKVGTSGFGKLQKNKNVGGRPLKIDGKTVAYGFGTHANSVIGFDIPAGYERFQARGGLDNGGTDQGTCGKVASVQFSVYTKSPPKQLLVASRSGGGGAVGSREASEAVAGLDVAEGLKAQLFSSEPDLLSLTNLDIDHRGRVWVCEVVNYRGNNGKRPAGDRILILEDTDGDGKCDRQKVYFQGKEVDSAMGICVLGNRVIVSCSPNVWIFTDEDGDDKPDKRELLFTKTGGAQHDHSAHSFIFGPDGKLYWNFGNTGKAVHDRDGKPVVDTRGNTVVDNGKPYFGGMVFRCNVDGSDFEVLAHNFRNNYEVTVDSFGTIWQSDNDDDGNKAVRINYVMEHGNYGYRDEKTGAGWKSKRTGMHEEIPLRHWHLRDPGVVPNLLQTGAGSPTGITVYEGRLLPKVFWDQVIHCDAGPNVTRAYPVTRQGAGYAATITNVLHGARDNWFRPADVCVAPDGSLFVSDWYDPGVGGHRQGDIERGRLFRVAPAGTRYAAPKFDFSTAKGAVEALTNPALSVRYMAWTALDQMGARAEGELSKLANSGNPRHRARALWLLARIDGKAGHYIQQAAGDSNVDIRVASIRIARSLERDTVSLLKRLVNDSSPQVRRECAIALRGHTSDAAPALWAALAQQHDGKDRWYLESLGIGAEGQWDAYFGAWLELAGSNWATNAGRDIVWRSRAKATPGYLAKILLDKKTPAKSHPRYLRAFDFLSGPEKDQALKTILGL